MAVSPYNYAYPHNLRRHALEKVAAPIFIVIFGKQLYHIPSVLPGSDEMNYGWLSLVPPLLAIILAFVTREPVVSLAVACLVGVLIMGQGIVGFPALLVRTIGSEDFMWVCLIEICIGILVAFYQRCGTVDMFGQKVESLTRSRSQTQFLAWGLGLFIFFSDYFSPLFTGPVMRKLTDKAKISRPGECPSPGHGMGRLYLRPIDRDGSDFGQACSDVRFHQGHSVQLLCVFFDHDGGANFRKNHS
jgi:hypothetical protein